MNKKLFVTFGLPQQMMSVVDTCSWDYVTVMELALKLMKKEAARMFQLAVDDENSDGYVQLGYCYKNGIGVEKDGKEAIRLLAACCG